jgi:Transcriptional regulators
MSKEANWALSIYDYQLLHLSLSPLTRERWGAYATKATPALSPKAKKGRLIASNLIQLRLVKPPMQPRGCWMATLPPLFVIVTNQMLVGVFFRELDRRRLSVPKDCSVLVFEDAQMLDHSRIPLTELRVPARRMGVAAVELLQDQLQEASHRRINRKVIHFDLELILRQSTGPAPKC